MLCLAMKVVVTYIIVIFWYKHDTQVIAKHRGEAMTVVVMYV